MNDKNSYYNEAIDFYIEKPPQWAFFPTPWAMNIRNKTALSNPEINQMLQQANTPFVYMQKPLDRDDIAFPTAQATCRHFAMPDKAEMERLARLQLQGLKKSFADFKQLDFSLNRQISDCPANYFKVQFSVKNEQGRVFKCLSQNWSIFNNDICYTLGLSGAVENVEEYQADHEDMINSVLIGKSVV